jgi:hypothetical protein
MSKEQSRKERLRKADREALADAATVNYIQLQSLLFNKPTYDVRATTKNLNDKLTPRQVVLEDNDEEETNG